MAQRCFSGLSARFILFVIAAWLPMSAGAQEPSGNWPNFRGPDLNGSATARQMPEKWDAKDGPLWSSKLPGPGSSTPAIWGERIFLTAAERAGAEGGANSSGTVVGIALDAAGGKVLWSRPLGPNRRAGYGDMTSPSPVTDGQRVVFMTGDGRLLACDFSGQQLWQRDLKQELGAMSWSFGYGASPLMHDARLYIQLMRRPSGRSAPGAALVSFLLAVDPATGKDLWREARPGEALEESWESYMTPIVHRARSGAQIVLAGADAITGHDAQTGKELWRCNFNQRRIRNWRLVPTPVSDGERIYVLLPRGVELVALEPAEGVALLEERTTWKLTTNAPDVCSPLLYGGRLYILDGDRKVMTCLEPKTGRQIWRGELGGDAVIRSSPTAADGKIYVIDERGQVFVLAAGDSFRVIARVEMGGGQPARSGIAIAGNRLYIRTADALHSIAAR